MVRDFSNAIGVEEFVKGMSVEDILRFIELAKRREWATIIEKGGSASGDDIRLLRRAARGYEIPDGILRDDNLLSRFVMETTKRFFTRR